MSKNRKRNIPLFSSQATATVSVAMVLLILGIVALLGVATTSLTRSVKENVGFVAMLKGDVTDEQVGELRGYLSKAAFVKDASYASREDVLTRWKELSGDEDDIAGMLGVNPFSAEIDVKVTADYACSDSIEKIVAPLRGLAYIEEVTVHTEMVDSLNKTVDTLQLALVIVAMALLLISFGLINNTVRLTVYGRRFTIHTMQLVGATNAYIRRPIVSSNMIGGVIAGCISAVILLGMVYYCMEIDPMVGEVVGYEDVAIVSAGMVIAGMLICSVAATLAANHYLKSDYDSMFG